jgi:hypothetical protein
MKQNFEQEKSELPNRLGSLSDQERQTAEETLQQMGEEGVEQLLEVVRKEAENRRKQKRMQRIIQGTILSVIALLFVLYTLRALFSIKEWDFGDLSFLFVFISLFGGAAAASQLQKNATSLLAKYDDLRAVGPLADALDIEDGDIRAVCREALTRLLPRLQASDAALLSPEQRENLNLTLKKADLKQDAELILAILQAWQQVGDEKAVPYVERLTQLKNDSEAGTRIREAAQACLPYLQERLEKARLAGMLLRPAAAPDNPAEMLLRPAPGAAPADPAHLLRPATQGNPEPPVG